jgi:hypothetical protein
MNGFNVKEIRNSKEADGVSQSHNSRSISSGKLLSRKVRVVSKK